MRILWVKYGTLFPPDTGGRKRTWAMLREIVRAGHELHYLALKTPDVTITDEEMNDRYATRKTWLDHREAAKGSPAFFLDLLGNFTLSRRPYVLDRYRCDAWREAIEQHAKDADVVVCDFLTPAPNFEGLRLLCPVVLFQHNIESQIWKRLADTAGHAVKRAYLASQYRRMWRAEKELSEGFEGIITVSPEDSAFCREQYQLRRVLGDVPTGVDVDAFQPPAKPAAAPVIGFLGSMDWMPNIDGVLWFAREVLPKVREQMPEVRVKIIGRNPPASIRALAADPAIEVTGTVPEVQPHVHECRVIAVPLLAGGGTRIKIFEAMAMGVPVISTTIGAEGLPVRHGEEIEIADDAESFAKGTLKLLADAGAAARMASNARELMEQRFSWRFAASKFVELCQQAMDHQQRPS
jgi:glycosyltransferase involved in cell wall biosynthesis